MAVEGEVPLLQGGLGLGFHQDVRFGEILAGEELRLDVDHLLPFEALGVGALGRDALQGVEEGWGEGVQSGGEAPVVGGGLAPRCVL